MTKSLTNLDVKNILIGLEGTDFKTKQLPVAFLWAFKINLNKLREVEKMYDEARQELIDLYSSDDKSYNEDIVDENGDSHTQRKIKNEFFEAWRKDNQDLLAQSSDFEFNTVDLDCIKNVEMSPIEFELLSQFMFDI